MPRKEVLKNVPANKVAAKEESFRIDGATKVEKKDNGDGTFDLIATFPNGG